VAGRALTRSTRVDIPAQRLVRQRIVHPHAGSAPDLVAHLGAVQAQEYPFAKWGLGLRLGSPTTDADITRAFDTGQILRTHVLRPTWHFVAAEDIDWMLQLTAPRVHFPLRSQARCLGLDTGMFTRATSLFERALAGGRHLTRAELAAALARAGLTLSPQVMGLVALYAELERVICSGPRRGRQFTYALLSERVRRPRWLSGDEALAELTRRFFKSHGPATVRDCVWWSGLKSADVRRGLGIINASTFEQDGLTYWFDGHAQPAVLKAPDVHLLPIYDEYLVAYRDRLAVPHGQSVIATGASAVTFRHALVIDGQVAGTWRVEADRSTTTVRVTPLRRLRRPEESAVEAAAARYGRFLGTSTTCALD
jgi:hypothetical protein